MVHTESSVLEYNFPIKCVEIIILFHIKHSRFTTLGLLFLTEKPQFLTVCAAACGELNRYHQHLTAVTDTGRLLSQQTSQKQINNQITGLVFM